MHKTNVCTNVTSARAKKRNCIMFNKHKHFFFYIYWYEVYRRVQFFRQKDCKFRSETG